MKKLVLAILMAFPALAWAGENVCITSAGNFTAPTCDSNGGLRVTTYMSADGIIANATRSAFKRAFANVNASTTDGVVVAAVTAKSIVVISVVVITGVTATTITFNTKPAGAGTAISPLLYNSPYGGEVLPFNPSGWFVTVAGEGLSVTTGAGATTGVLVTYYEL